MSHDAIAVKLPNNCVCGCITAKIIDANAVCDRCGQKRFTVSALTLRTLTRVSQMFGAPIEPIIFRSTDAREKIRQHDLVLQNKYARDGRSFYEIIGDVGDPSIDSDGVEAINDTELY